MGISAFTDIWHECASLGREDPADGGEKRRVRSPLRERERERESESVYVPIPYYAAFQAHRVQILPGVNALRGNSLCAGSYEREGLTYTAAPFHYYIAHHAFL